MASVNKVSRSSENMSGDVQLLKRVSSRLLESVKIRDRWLSTSVVIWWAYAGLELAGSRIRQRTLSRLPHALRLLGSLRLSVSCT